MIVPNVSFKDYSLIIKQFCKKTIAQSSNNSGCLEKFVHSVNFFPSHDKEFQVQCITWLKNIDNTPLGSAFIKDLVEKTNDQTLLISKKEEYPTFFNISTEAEATPEIALNPDLSVYAVCLDSKGAKRIFHYKNEDILLHELVHYWHHLKGEYADNYQVGFEYRFDTLEELISILGFSSIQNFKKHGIDYCENALVHGALKRKAFRISHRTIELNHRLDHTIHAADLAFVGALGTLKDEIKQRKSEINQPISVHSKHFIKLYQDAKVLPLTAAFLEEQEETLKYLLNYKKIDLSVKDDLGGPLGAAAKFPWNSMAVILFKKSLEKTTKDESANLIKLLSMHCTNTYLFKEKKKEPFEMLEALFKKFPALAEDNPDLLFLAATDPEIELFEMLLPYYKNVNIQENDGGDTPLLAILNCYVKINYQFNGDIEIYSSGSASVESEELFMKKIKLLLQRKEIDLSIKNLEGKSFSDFVDQRPELKKLLP